MTAVKLPGQMEVPLQIVRDSPARPVLAKDIGITYDSYIAQQGRILAKALSSYDESPTSQKWIDIQQLAREILK